MKNYSMIFFWLSSSTVTFMISALFGLPAWSQETNITCSVEVEGEDSVLTCLNENGTPASFHFQAALSRRIYLEYGLTLLGCAVPKIDGDMSDASDSITCVQNMFDLPSGELSREDAHYITAAAGNVHSREEALRYLATRGYRPVAARVTQTELPQLVGRVPLSFPIVEEPPVGKLSIISNHRYYNFVYDAKISFERVVSLTNLQPQLKTQRSPQAEASFLRKFVTPVAMLLDPSDEPLGGALKQAWQEVLYEESRYTRFFTGPVMAAITEAPPVHQCTYDQYSAAPADDRNYLTSARSIRLAFWSGSVPAAIRPEALRAFQAPEMGLHPLLVIGPPIEACPETLGSALEVMATQFPGQVPATEPPALIDLEDAALAGAEPRLDFDYLPRSTRRYFAKILEGDASAGDSAANKIGVYLAFHRAFAASCRSEMGEDTAEYTFTRQSLRLNLRETEQIRLRSSDFDEFYLAAASLIPVVILEYDENPTKDFDIRKTYQIRVATDARTQSAFAEVLAREGCRADLAEDLHAALSDNLPQMTATAGESTVSMYFQTNTGARSLNVTLSSPYDPDSIRATKIVSSSDTGLFPLGGDYGGRMLSYIALGDFPAARGEQRKSSDEVIRQIRALGPTGFNPVADLYEWGFRNSANFNPMSALITSYIIRRVQILGSCGDPLVPITRNYVEIETTRMGGVEIGSREIGSYSREAIVPAAFKHIVERAEDITPGINSRELVDGAIDRLSCDSEMRRNLEANMIAFNSGEDPAWVSPENIRKFGSGEDNGEAGQSAYIYTDFDAAVELIEDASRKDDSRFSLRYDLKDDSDRSAAQLNLLLIDDIPAMVFDTSYFGRKPGGRNPGRMVRLIMTCAESGEIEVSQFLSSTEPNDLDPDSIYTITYSAYGLDNKWPMTANLESVIADSNSFTFARFRGRIPADDTTFVGLRPTSNFISSLKMANGNYNLSFGVDGGRVDTTLAPLIDHCRSIKTP